MKPGRKLVEEGPSACSDAEILAILIGTGGRGYTALDCANHVLERYGTLANLMDQPLIGLTETRGTSQTSRPSIESEAPEPQFFSQ